MVEDYMKGVASLKEIKDPVLYGGSDIRVTIKNVFLNPKSGLPAVTEKGFDASKLTGVDLIVYGFNLGQNYEEVSRIDSADGQNIYNRKKELKQLKGGKVKGLVKALNNAEEELRQEKQA